MKMFKFNFLIALIAFLNVNADSSERPNIMIILTDDMGFSDLGCFGGEIDTPNLDSLASTGLRFTEFYNTARCWPTRLSFLRSSRNQVTRPAWWASGTLE